MEHRQNRRILVVDDNVAIHADFAKTLLDAATESASFADAEAALFDDAPAAGTAARPAASEAFEIDFASQGRQGFEMVRAAHAEGRPYALAFVDVRMPPGWDGVDTIARMWEVDAELQAVVCTAFADYTWQEMIGRLGRGDRLLILKKPFDTIEVRQIASSLTEKWNSVRRERLHLETARAAVLEARAYSSSLETLNRALETSHRAAESVAEAKSNLLLSLTRGLCIPADRVVAAARRLLALQSPGPAEAGASELCRDALHLRRTLQDAVDLAELEAGRARLAETEYSPRELAREALESAREASRERSLAFELACAPSLSATVRGDAGRVRRILAHLLDHAVRNAPEHGFVRLAVRLEDAGGAGAPELVLEVLDSSRGPSREEERFLFEPFVAPGAAEREPASEPRLGLPLARRLAHRLGGELTLERLEDGTSALRLRLWPGVPCAGEARDADR